MHDEDDIPTPGDWSAWSAALGDWSPDDEALERLGRLGKLLGGAA